MLKNPHRIRSAMNRRDALRGLIQLLLSSPLLAKGLPDLDPVLEPVNVFDFAKLAEEKLDPVAWDYMAEGAKDEVALRDAREAFNRIIIRPRFLRDVHKIDITTELFGQSLPHPIFIDPAGGKNCFYPNGEPRLILL